MRYISLFSGIEAASVAWELLGWEPVAFAEFDKFPSAVLAHRYPDVSNLGDMTKVDWKSYRGKANLVVGGSPCFPSGARVLTRRGLVPIESVVVGDEVITHKNRWQRVLRTGSTVKPTVILKGQGHPGLEATPNHPFWAATKSRRTTRVKGGAVGITSVSETSWVPAEKMSGSHWTTPAEFPYEMPPSFPVSGNDAPLPEFSAPMWRVFGAWVGDGWARFDDRRGSLVFGIGTKKKKKDFLFSALKKAGLSYSTSEEPTGTKVFVYSKPLAKWTTEHFGKGAHGKKLPSWIYGMPLAWRTAFLEGYIATDGTPSESCRGNRVSTVSWELAIGVRVLAATTGHASSVSYAKNKRAQCVIEGRVVNESPYYTVTVSNSERSSFSRNGQRYGLVRKVLPGRPHAEVFNIEVEEDHSYTVDGFVVKNCQAFSVAGLRKSMDDTRGNLTLAYMRVIHDVRPKWFVWENVPGVLNTKDNAFGCFLAGLSGADAPLVSGDEKVEGKWGSAGVVVGKEYSMAWRVVDAQHFGVPQRRRRVFLVGHLGDWHRAAQVLFESQGVSGDPAARGSARKGIAAGVEEGAGGGDGVDDLLGGAPLVGKKRAKSHWDGGPHPSLTQASKKSGGIGASNQEIFAQGGAGLVSADAPKGTRKVAHGRYVDDDSASTVLARDFKDATDLVIGPRGYGAAEGLGHTLKAKSNDSHDATHDTYVAGEKPVVTARETGHGFWMESEQAGTLRAEGESRPSRPSNVIVQRAATNLDDLL